MRSIISRFATLALISFFLPHAVFGLDPSTIAPLLTEIGRKNFAATERFLQTNRDTLSHDPDYYVVLLNYVLSKGEHETVVADQGVAGPDDLTLRNLETGQGGRLKFDVRYDQEFIANGITRTQAALKDFRTRLDIHLGIIAVAERIERWDIVAQQLIETLKTSKEINNRWTWGSVGSIAQDKQQFMIDNVLNRTATLFQKNTPLTDKEFITVSTALVTYYPELVYGYANLGTFHLAQKEYARAKEFLTKAHSIAPDDEIVNDSLAKLKAMKPSK